MKNKCKKYKMLIRLPVYITTKVYKFDSGLRLGVLYNKGKQLLTMFPWFFLCFQNGSMTKIILIIDIIS
jgi:hypothetical protein